MGEYIQQRSPGMAVLRSEASTHGVSAPTITPLDEPVIFLFSKSSNNLKRIQKCYFLYLMALKYIE